MRILRATEHKRMPWKNGKGETVEIAVFPPGATVDDFDWRVSMATVADDGPFSVFEGIDRTLSVLSGEGMRLAVAGAEAVDLVPGSAPYAFAADVETDARLHHGPITDLNVMTRRGRFTHHVMSVAPPFKLGRAAGQCLIVCSKDRLELAVDGRSDLLGLLDCAVFAMGEDVEVRGNGEGFLVSLRAADPGEA